MKKILSEYLKTDYKFDKTTMFAIICGLWGMSGIFGFVYEIIFYYFNSGMKHWYWRGGCFGPWILIYCIGGVVIYYTTRKFKNKPWLILLISAVGSAILEGGVGAFIYYAFDGKRNWDYNTEILNFGNIGGFICFRSILIFAISGLILMYVMVPMLFYLEKHINKKAFCTIFITLGMLNVVDELYNTVLCKIFPALTSANEFYTSIGFNLMHFG